MICTTRRLVSRFLLLLAIVLCAQTVVSAQQGTPNAVDSAAAASPSEALLSSPRDTLKTFSEAMESVQAGDESRLQQALECLYLDDLPEAVRREQGAELANRLFNLLDQVVFTLDSVAVETSGRNYTVELGALDKRVELTFRQYDDGKWRFSYENTLSRLDDMAKALEPDEEDDQEVREYDPRFRSPRHTLRTFVNSVNNWREGGMIDAIAAFDLSGIDNESVRLEKGRELAVQLMRVLNRTKYVRFNEIPLGEDIQVYHLLEDPVGDLTLRPSRIEDSGLMAWRFTADTLDAIPKLYDFYRDAPLVPELRKEDLPQLASLRLRDAIRRHMPFLLGESFYLENWQWLGLLGIVLAGMAASRLVTFLLILSIRGWFTRSRLTLDAKKEKDFVRPIRVAIMSWVWLLGLSTLGLPPSALLYLALGAKTITAVAAAWAAYRLVDILGEFLGEKAARTDNKFDDLLVPFLTRTLKVFVVVFGIVVVAETLELDYKSVLAGLGIGGLAFALAAKDTVANVFGSLTVVLDRPFQIGDWIVVNGAEGSVESVGMRSTRIRTFYNSLIAIPNSELINATVDNMGARRYRRWKTTIGVTYDTPPEKIEAFCEGIRELVRNHPYTRKDYYHVYLNEFGPSSLNILLYVFHETPDWGTELRERQRLFMDILRLAQQLGVEFAFPTQTLYMRNEETPEHSNIPPDPEQAHQEGRRVAGKVMQHSLGPDRSVPPPVNFSTPPKEAGPKDLSDTEDAS